MNNFLKELQKTIPEFNIKFKCDCLFMKIIGFCLFFNKEFMTSFITTMGNTVYFPSKEHMENIGEDRVNIILSHEFVHALDSKNKKLFKILYMFPQFLSPIFFILIFLSPLVLKLIFICLSILFILPIIPPYWRAESELRGYKMTMFTSSELMRDKIVPEISYNTRMNTTIEKINNDFTSSYYYWMKRSGVKDELIETFTKIKTDDILKDDPSYAIVRAALKNSK